MRKSMTPTKHCVSKVRRSILQDIPENKETEVVITPKTPRKTPKVNIYILYSVYLVELN
jgi:hypothetical protein